MKVLVFPALLAVAIITTPPKPFAAAEAGKPVTARTTVQPAQPAPLTSQTPQDNQLPAATPGPESGYTARR